MKKKYVRRGAIATLILIGLAFLLLLGHIIVAANNYEGRRESKLSNFYKAVPQNGCEHLYNVNRSLEWFDCMGVGYVRPTDNQRTMGSVLHRDGEPVLDVVAP